MPTLHFNPSSKYSISMSSTLAAFMVPFAATKLEAT
jgi:hypothetical protein